MIQIIVSHVLPAVFDLLPTQMDSVNAKAMLLAVGLQESRFLSRRQEQSGPARGFWQFERAGLAGLLTHGRSAPHLREVLRRLRYPEGSDAHTLQRAIEHNDILAGAIARLLLWTHPAPLPDRCGVAEAWTIYLDTWRPGRPHQKTWAACVEEAWGRLIVEGVLSANDRAATAAR